MYSQIFFIKYVGIEVYRASLMKIRDFLLLRWIDWQSVLHYQSTQDHIRDD